MVPYSNALNIPIRLHVLKIVWLKQDGVEIQEKTQHKQMWQIDINNLLLRNYYCALFVYQHIKSHTLCSSR
jgi:hypothetical protein